MLTLLINSIGLHLRSGYDILFTMLVYILGLIIFSIFNSLELYFAYKVGQGLKLSEAAAPVTTPIVERTKAVFDSIKPIHQNEVYEPSDEDYFKNEQEIEADAQRKIDEGLKELKQIKQGHE